MEQPEISPEHLEQLGDAFATLSTMAAALAPVEVRRRQAVAHLERVVALGAGLAERRGRLTREVTDRTDDEGRRAREVLGRADVDAALATVERARGALAMLQGEGDGRG